MLLFCWYIDISWEICFSMWSILELHESRSQRLKVPSTLFDSCRIRTRALRARITPIIILDMVNLLG